jgi:hypothetical protein
MADPVLEAPASGDIDGVNDLFEVSTAYYPGTVFLILDGQIIKSDDPMAPIELGGKSIQLGEAPQTYNDILFYYQVNPTTTGSGGLYGPPYIITADELLPLLARVEALIPKLETLEFVPRILDAEDTDDFENASVSILELVPRIISAEEV